MSDRVQAKRKAPAKISPISVGNKIIEDTWEKTAAGFSVYLVSKDSTEKTIRWKTKLYGRTYNQDLEKDVQEIHLKSLGLTGTLVIAIDEKNQRYEMDLESGKLLVPRQPVEYPKRN